MTGKTHLAGGVFTGVLVASHLNLDAVNAAGVITISGIAALFPDIDTPTSKIGMKVKPVSMLINRIFGHRTLLHAPLIYLAIALGLYAALPFRLSLSLAGGVLSHLLLDSITRRGIPWLYPFKRTCTGFTPIRANGFVDWLLFYGLSALSAYAAMTHR